MWFRHGDLWWWKWRYEFEFLLWSYMNLRSWFTWGLDLCCHDDVLLFLCIRFGFVLAGVDEGLLCRMISKPWNGDKICISSARCYVSTVKLILFAWFIGSEIHTNIACHVFDGISELNLSSKLNIYWIWIMPIMCLLILQTYLLLIAWAGIYLMLDLEHPRDGSIL